MINWYVFRKKSAHDNNQNKKETSNKQSKSVMGIHASSGYSSSNYDDDKTYAVKGREHFKETTEPKRSIDLPCGHFMTYISLSNQVEWYNSGYVKCPICPKKYVTESMF